MTDQITKTLISGLRTQRQAAGYTQEMLGQLLKIQRATYCNYENGIRTPSLEILVTLAELYHVSTDYLMYESYLPENSPDGGQHAASFSTGCSRLHLLPKSFPFLL